MVTGSLEDRRMVAMCLRRMVSRLPAVGACERSRSETLPVHLGSVKGVINPGHMGSTTHSESVHLCAEFEKLVY